MNKHFFAATAAACGLFASFCLPAYADPPGGAAGWTKTFDDPCNASTVDTTKWSLYSLKGAKAIINSPLTLNSWDAVSEKDGCLTITCTASNVAPYKFKSAQIATNGLFSQSYGYLEARMKVPGGRYAWPAFWTLPADGTWPPEIDVLELNGHANPATDYQTYHFYDINNHRRRRAAKPSAPCPTPVGAGPPTFTCTGATGHLTTSPGTWTACRPRA